MELKGLIRNIPDFPKPGVLFRDISELLKSADALNFVATEFSQKTALLSADYVAGIESRGFILAALLAAKFNKGFIPLRKKGKLPPPTLGEKYSLEYGQAELEISPGRGRVMVVDDVLATGGTLTAGISICKKAGFDVIDVGVLINLKSLNDLHFKNKEIFSLVQY